MDAIFSRDNYETLEVSSSSSFSSTDLNFGSFIAKLQFQNCVSGFGNLKNFSSYHDKTPPLSITKMFGVLAAKYKQSGL